MSWNFGASEGAATCNSASESVPSLSTSAADQCCVERTAVSLLLSMPCAEAELWLDMSVPVEDAVFAWSWSALVAGAVALDDDDVAVPDVLGAVLMSDEVVEGAEVASVALGLPVAVELAVVD
jgi:hypothetical protein